MTIFSQQVRVSDGAIEYTWPTTLTETTGKNISGDTVQISLGTYTVPGPWMAPDVITNPTTSSVTVQTLIDSTVPPGTYWLWCRITDSPEVVPRRGPRIDVI